MNTSKQQADVWGNSAAMAATQVVDGYEFLPHQESKPTERNGSKSLAQPRAWVQIYENPVGPISHERRKSLQTDHCSNSLNGDKVAQIFSKGLGCIYEPNIGSDSLFDRDSSLNNMPHPRCNSRLP